VRYFAKASDDFFCSFDLLPIEADLSTFSNWVLAFDELGVVEFCFAWNSSFVLWLWNVKD
jgi:hypothetical protein